MVGSTTSTATKNPLKNSSSVNLNGLKEFEQPYSSTKMRTIRQVLLQDPEDDSPESSPDTHIANNPEPIIADPILEAVKELNPISEPGSPSASQCYQSALSISFSQYTEHPRDSFATARISEVTTAAGSIKNVGYEPSGSEECSMSSDISDDTSSNGLIGGNMNKPHMGNDSRWDAIRAVHARSGAFGFNHFRLLKRLGCGDIGSVYLAELSGTRSYFAMKVMDKVALEARKKLPRAQTERDILQCLDHPFLPTLYTHFETEKFSCLVMEFCPGGDLHTLRQRQPGKYFSEHAARFYVAEVLLALEYLHMLGIIYRDLKPENVLVREDGHIMLSDFDLSLRCTVSPTLVKSSKRVTFDISSKPSSGFCAQPSCSQPSACIQPTCFGPRRFLTSNRSKDGKNNGEVSSTQFISSLPELIAEPTSARSMSFVGTHEYLAPEIIKGEGHGSAVDWWTFGIFLYELLFGKTPFKGSGNRATLFNVVGEQLRFPESPTVSFAARDLIRGLLVKEPRHRIAYRRGATEVKQHPFFQNVNWALIRCASPPEIPRVMKKNSDHLLADGGGGGGGGGGGDGNAEGFVDLKPTGKYVDMDFF